MDWKAAAVAFGTIFLAELGDKTQLGVFGLAGSSGSKWAVFLGASLALIVSTGLAVVGGGLVARVVPVVWMQRGAGVLFILLGVVYLARTWGAGGGPT